MAIFAEMNEAVQKIEAELRTERAKAGRAEKVHQRTREDLALAHAEVHRLKACATEMNMPRLQNSVKWFPGAGNGP